jgi:hypothetical protein
MNRVLGHCLAGLAVVTGALSLAAGCVHDDSSFFVQAVIYPQPQGAGTQCTYTANPSQVFLSRGLFDAAINLNGQYSAEFLLANQLVTESNPNQVQTETSNIRVEGAIVRDTDAAGNQLDSFTSFTSGTIYAAVGGTPGYAAINAVIVSSKAVKGAGVPPFGMGATMVVAYVKFFGHTLGGTYIESNEFEFPVDVCTGCLIQFSASDIDPCYSNVNCKNAVNAMGGSTATTGPCVPGQDTPIDCSACLRNPLCNPDPGTYICDAGTSG